MKRIILLLAILFAFQFTLRAQTTFQKVITVQGTSSFISTGIHQCNDGGYILCGYDIPLNNAGAFIIKIDTAFQILWMKSFRDPNFPDLIIYNAGECIGGGYFALGSSYDSNNACPCYILLKMDLSGTVLWTRKYLTADYPSLLFTPYVRQFPSGEFLINTGSHGSMGVIKTDSSGNILFAESFRADTTSITYGSDAIPCNDGGILAVGIKRFDPYFVKTDSAGNVLWSKIFSMPYSEISIYRVMGTSDGGYISVGQKTDFISGNISGFLLKTDASGNLLWYKEYSSWYRFHFINIKPLSNGNFLLAGMDPWSNAPIIVITDTLGNLQSSRSFGLSEGFASYIGLEVSATDKVLLSYTHYDSVSGITVAYLFHSADLNFSWCDITNFPLTSDTVNYNPTVSSGAVIRYITLVPTTFPIEQTVPITITDYCLNSSINDAVIKNGNTVFPNPFSSTATIEVDPLLIDNSTVFILYDLLGHEVETVEIKNEKTEIEKGSLASGIYMYKIISANGIIGSGKIILAD